MMTVEQALEKMLAAIRPITDEQTVDIIDSLGRISAEDCIAESPVPPFARSAMDGYAVRAADIQDRAAKHAPADTDGKTRVVLRVAGKLLAGDYRELDYEPGTAVRVMTGAYVPDGYDAVVKQEDTDMGEVSVEIRCTVKPYENYCKTGENMAAGHIAVAGGTLIRPIHMGLLAAAGKSRINVVRQPRITVIVTGSELLRPGQAIQPGKIYDSIGYMISGAASQQGIKVSGPHICGDDAETAERLLQKALSEADFIITTGAISVGEKDFIPALMQKMGADLLFRGADIQPGTPTMASRINDKVILSLSGNPYAALANFEVYFWEAMARMTGCRDMLPQQAEALLADRYDKVNSHRRLIRAMGKDGRVFLPAKVHSSSVIGNMDGCNCFIDLEAGRSVKPGDTVKIRYIKGM